MPSLGSRLYDRFGGRATHAMLFCTMLHLETDRMGAGRETSCRRWLCLRLLAASECLDPTRPRDAVIRDLDSTIGKRDLRAMLRIIRYLDWCQNGGPQCEGYPVWFPGIGPVFLPVWTWGHWPVLT